MTSYFSKFVIALCISAIVVVGGTIYLILGYQNTYGDVNMYWFTVLLLVTTGIMIMIIKIIHRELEEPEEAKV